MRRHLCAAGLGAVTLACALAAEVGVRGPAPVTLRLWALAAAAVAGMVVAQPDVRRDITSILAWIKSEALTHRRDLLALALLTVGAGTVRISLLGLDSRYDEAFTWIMFASLPLSEGAGVYPDPNNHLFHTVLVHLSARVFGASLWAIRLPAVVAGVLLVPAIYAAGRTLYGRQAALLAAALAVGWPPLVEYSVNARGYSLAWLAFAVLIPLSAHLAARRDLAAAIVWVVVATLGTFTMPTFILALAVVGFWLATLLLVDRKLRRLLELAGMAIAVTALTLWLYSDVLGDTGWHYQGPVVDSKVAFAGGVWLFITAQTGMAGPIFAAALVVSAVLAHRQVGRQRVSLPLIGLLASGFIAAVLPRPPPFERSWTHLAVVALPALAAGVWLGLRRAPKPGYATYALALSLALALGVATATGQAPFAKDDAPSLGAHETVRWLKLERPNATLIVSRYTQPSMLLHLMLEGVPTKPSLFLSPDGQPRLLTTQLSPATASGERLLGVSRARGENPAQVMSQVGLGPPFPSLRHITTFQEFDIYSLD